MRQTRRDWLKGSSAVAASLGLAGCAGMFGSDETDEETGTPTDEPVDGTDEAEQSSGGDGGLAATDVAVAAEWNAMRTRLWNAVALGRAGSPEAGAGVAQATFARFEEASGEHNAHEALESTSETAYEEFESALGELRTAGLDVGDVGRASEEASIGSDQLHSAQRTRVGDTAAQALDLQALGARVADAAMLADAGAFEGAATVAEAVLARFENAPVHGALEAAEGDAYARFEGGVDAVVESARSEDAASVRADAETVLTAAIDGSYRIAPAEAVAGSGHVAVFQALGWDAAALSRIGGPSTEFAHAAALTVYRARVRDAVRLYEAGQTAAARAAVEAVFAHFEGARAHEALEEASEDAYHQFEEDGLAALSTAIDEGDDEGVQSAVETVDDALLTGIETLGTGDEPALLEAGYFRARLADAVERYDSGETAAAAAVASGLFETFERDEAGFHETLEHTSEDLYHTFEEEHLDGLITAFEAGDDGAVETHASGAMDALLSFETTAGSTAQVSAVESGYMAARGFDARALAIAGANDRAATALEDAFGHFEAGAGGFHEALEHADHELYESFETALSDARGAAGSGDPTEAVRSFNDRAVEAIYTVVSSAGGSQSAAAAGIVEDAFARFESARVHELLEEADHDAYEGFEGALGDLGTAVEDGGVSAAASAFADASLRAQFAVAGAPDAAPVGASDADGGAETELSGGPNVVEGVPEDADHVVDMNAVAFDPAELTVSAGDTVAWTHAGGEAHSVTAVEDELPDGATYWASGDFESESAAREGWEHGQGAVQSGQSYVRTFETTGEHAYVCIPHEAAGMVGTVVVE
ncbi:DUF5059 domain-containing protein [Haloarchaeobius iranensis]|uniref:Plastocyanin n=1 Tax=Haloarchaeobius iranensis TaxID=996166 RepID=A0A1G9Y3K7_9EURY|nr:DUF5059 domain-containing protein [Haloarchaeobius iranensis]SDN03063.1 Plastocyanin [Haloarchaeobius iranensis]